MEESSKQEPRKKSSKNMIIIIVLGVVLIGIIVGIILLTSLSNKTNDVSYQEDPEIFCHNNPEHVLCSDEEISYWDDPVNFCLKYPDDEGCEKTGETDFCEKNPDSALCDDDSSNDYDWVDDYVSEAFGSTDGSEIKNSAMEILSDAFKELAICMNDAGFHIDSFDAYQKLTNESTLEDNYNIAQISKINTCGSEFNNAIYGTSTNE